MARPKIGPQLGVSLPKPVIEAIERYGSSNHMSRMEATREVIEHGLMTLGIKPDIERVEFNEP